MFAAGQLLMRKEDVEECLARGGRGTSMLVERTGLFSVFDEGVLLAYFTPQTKKNFKEWNKGKEKLYNETMEKLCLDFRFLWLFDTPATRRETAQRMSLISD